MTKITLPPAEKTPWEVLSAVDLTGRIEKKNGLSYVSWAWAWGELKNHYPHAWFRKHEGDRGYPCFYDPQGYAFVKVTVGLDKTTDHEVTEMLPVLDHRNKPIQAPSSFDINNALQRCLAKAIAYLGLGHYIYAGEDLPDVPTEGSTGAQASAGTSTPQNQQTPSQGASNAQNAPTVFAPNTEPVQQSFAANVIAATLIEFIPHCTDDQMLTRYYSLNKSARDYLLQKDKEQHDAVVAAFSAAKKKLAAQKNETQQQEGV